MKPLWKRMRNLHPLEDLFSDEKTGVKKSLAHARYVIAAGFALQMGTAVLCTGGGTKTSH